MTARSQCRRSKREIGADRPDRRRYPPFFLAPVAVFLPIGCWFAAQTDERAYVTAGICQAGFGARESDRKRHRHQTAITTRTFGPRHLLRAAARLMSLNTMARSSETHKEALTTCDKKTPSASGDALGAVTKKRQRARSGAVVRCLDQKEARRFKPFQRNPRLTLMMRS